MIDIDPKAIALIVAAVSAIRVRVPEFDGAWVLLLAAVVTAIVQIATGFGGWQEQLLSALLLWVGAVGSVSTASYLIRKGQCSGKTTELD